MQCEASLVKIWGFESSERIGEIPVPRDVWLMMFPGMVAASQELEVGMLNTVSGSGA
jgi:hypothetical protein